MIESNFQIQPVELPDDLDSNWFHPDIAAHDTINENSEYYTQEQFDQLQVNLGVKISIERCWYEDIPEIPEEDYSDWSKWKPKPPTSDHFLIAAFDTEDGPRLWWAKAQGEGHE
ncbi:hypothetical protein LVY74_16645 [Acinetobacter sp. ME22]|uniref:hypothetical protein n=1 Tax=Acinetobacter sp. ME22 TaxID=2904802 RepID=UPI001EDB2F0B|nr:hypothetical protein [Acinetobacter sp. ME22]MCG2575167.1 hypothetical protein [Acinetobacter sp. ME22]